MKHDALALDLAAHLRTEKRMVWCDVQLGPAGSPRPDVFAIYKSFVRPAPTAYEVKRTLSDFRSDVTSGKWTAYLQYAGAVYFAVEAGLGITKAHVPAHCGLLVRGPHGWRPVKKPVLNPVVIPQEAMLKLLMDGIEREGLRPRWVHVPVDRALAKVKAALGADAAKFCRDMGRAREELADCERQRKDIIDRALRDADRTRKEADAEALAGLKGDLAEAVGLDRAANLYLIRDKIRKLRDSVGDTALKRNHAQLVAQLRILADRFEVKES